MPNALKFPRMLRAIVPLVGPRHAVVSKIVADSFPCFSGVVRTLYYLAKPAARLRRIQPVGIAWRPGDVIDLPSGKMWAIDRPVFALLVRTQNESAFARTNENTDFAHIHIL